MNNERLTKKQVCSLLKIGYSTLGRWMREGKIKFTREQAVGAFESAVFFRRADLAEFLPSAPIVASIAAPVRNAAPSKVGHYEDEPAPRAQSRENADLSFAEAYKAGDATDSAGNKIDGTNDRFRTKGIQSLLGPIEVEKPVVSGTSHMNPALVGGAGESGNTAYINSLEYHLKAGSITQEQYEEMQSASVKARRQCEQTNKTYLDKAAILAAFKHGYSR